MERKKAWGAALVGVVALGALYLGFVAYLFCSRSEACDVYDADLMVELPDVADEENKYTAFLDLTNMVRTAAREDRSFLEALHTAAARPHYQEPKGRIIAFQGMVAVVKRWEAAMDHLCSAREFSAAASSLKDFYAITKSCRDEASSLVGVKVGCGLCDKVCGKVVTLAAEEGVSEEVLRALAEMVRDEPNVEEIFTRTLKCEYTFWTKPMINQALCLNVEAGRDALLAKAEPALTHAFGRFAGPVLARLLVFTPGYDQFSCPNAEMPQLWASHYREAKFDGSAPSAQQADLDALQPNWYGRQLTRKLVGTVTGQLRAELKKNLMMSRFARVIVALQRFAREHDGQYPATLDQLVPQYLDAVPADPFDVHGRIRYDRERKVVWSVGPRGEFTNPPPIDKRRRTHHFDSWSMRIDGRASE